MLRCTFYVVRCPWVLGLEIAVGEWGKRLGWGEALRCTFYDVRCPLVLGLEIVVGEWGMRLGWGEALRGPSAARCALRSG